MNNKKMMALLLSSTMIISMLAGCGAAESKQEETKKSEPESKSEEVVSSDEVSEEEVDDGTITFPLEEPLTMTMTVVSGSEYLMEDTETFKKMEELTNVHWDITYIKYDEAAEKMGLHINSDSYTDVFFKCDLDVWKYNEILIPMEDLLQEYAPNYMKLVEERDIFKQDTFSDGHVYGTNYVHNPGLMDLGMYINQKWLDNLDLEMPTNMEELYNVLSAFKVEDADGDGDPNNEVPLAFSNDLTTWRLILPFFGLVSLNNQIAMDTDTNEIYNFGISERFKEGLTYLAKMWEEGLIYDKTFTTSREQLLALAKTGELKIGTFFDWGANAVVDVSKLEPGSEREYVMVPAFDGMLYRRNAGLVKGILPFAISDKCEYPEIATAWIDYFYSEEGGNLAAMGVEGVTYTVTEDGKWQWVDEEVYGADPSAAGTAMNGGLSQPPLYRTDFCVEEMYYDTVTNPYAGCGIKDIAMLMDNGMTYVEPAIVFTEEESERFGILSADVNGYYSSYAAQCFTGEISIEDTWDDYVEAMKDRGVEELLEIYKAAYDRAN